MEPFTDIEEALRAIDRFTGEPEAFLLPISDALDDPTGVNTALLTDRALARGWMPDGFEPRAGYRVYRYTELD